MNRRHFALAVCPPVIDTGWNDDTITTFSAFALHENPLCSQAADAGTQRAGIPVQVDGVDGSAVLRQQTIDAIAAARDKLARCDQASDDLINVLYWSRAHPDAAGPGPAAELDDHGYRESVRQLLPTAAEVLRTYRELLDQSETTTSREIQ